MEARIGQDFPVGLLEIGGRFRHARRDFHAIQAMDGVICQSAHGRAARQPNDQGTRRSGVKQRGDLSRQKLRRKVAGV